MFIRLFAETDTSPVSMAALAYAQALLRFAPVRLISLSGMTGQLTGPWAVMERLLTTNMITPMINVVCSSQEHWSKTIEVGMPEKDGMHEAIATGKVADQKIETVKLERELYTVGVRNILIANALPTLPRYARAAAKYEAIVVPSSDLQTRWTPNDRGLIPVCVPVPVKDLKTLRTAIFGTT